MELSIALGLAGVLLSMGLHGFLVFERQQQTLQAWVELQQRGRVAVLTLLRLLREADQQGAGVKIRHQAQGGLLELQRCLPRAHTWLCRPLSVFVGQQGGLYQRFGEDRRQRLVSGVEHLTFKRLGSQHVQCQLTFCSQPRLSRHNHLLSRAQRWQPYQWQQRLCAEWVFQHEMA